MTSQDSSSSPENMCKFPSQKHKQRVTNTDKICLSTWSHLAIDALVGLNTDHQLVPHTLTLSRDACHNDINTNNKTTVFFALKFPPWRCLRAHPCTGSWPQPFSRSTPCRTSRWTEPRPTWIQEKVEVNFFTWTGSKIISDEHNNCIADHFGLQHMHLNNKNFKQTTTLGHQQGCALVQPFVVDPENCGGKSWAGGALWHCGVLRSGKSDKQMWNLTTNKYVWCCFGFLWVWAPGDIQDVHPHQDGQGRPRTKKIKCRMFSIPSNFHQ